MANLIGKKIFGAAAFMPAFTNYYMLKKSPAECDGENAEAAADDLEKIFAEGGGMMD